MDFSKLDRNEKLALYGAIAVFLAGLISFWGGLLWIAVLAAIGMVAVIFLPRTSVPGSRGTLMAALGLVALGAGLIEVLRYAGFIGSTLGSVGTIAFIVAIIGAAVMAYAGWQELQTEGGKWEFGSGTAPASAPAAPGAPSSAPPADVVEDRSPDA